MALRSTNWLKSGIACFCYLGNQSGFQSHNEGDISILKNLDPKSNIVEYQLPAGILSKYVDIFILKRKYDIHNKCVFLYCLYRYLGNGDSNRPDYCGSAFWYQYSDSHPRTEQISSLLIKLADYSKDMRIYAKDVRDNYLETNLENIRSNYYEIQRVYLKDIKNIGFLKANVNLKSMELLIRKFIADQGNIRLYNEILMTESEKVIYANSLYSTRIIPEDLRKNILGLHDDVQKISPENEENEAKITLDEDDPFDLKGLQEKELDPNQDEKTANRDDSKTDIPLNDNQTSPSEDSFHEYSPQRNGPNPEEISLYDPVSETPSPASLGLIDEKPMGKKLNLINVMSGNDVMPEEGIARSKRRYFDKYLIFLTLSVLLISGFILIHHFNFVYRFEKFEKRLIENVNQLRFSPDLMDKKVRIELAGRQDKFNSMLCDICYETADFLIKNSVTNKPELKKQATVHDYLIYLNKYKGASQIISYSILANTTDLPIKWDINDKINLDKLKNIVGFIIENIKSSDKYKNQPKKIAEIEKKLNEILMPKKDGH
jgi:hypothetical protein